MAKKKENQRDWKELAIAVGASSEGVEAAWEDLRRRGLVSAQRGKVTVSPLALRRATTDVQRRLAAFLSGYVVTENSYIVRYAGDPPSSSYILNTRIAVEYIANYFEEGWGVADIAQDLKLLTREEIEAAIQYYLNHRAEIKRDIWRSRELYEAHSRQEIVPA